MKRLVIAVTLGLAAAGGAQAAISSGQAARLASAAAVVREVNGTIPQEYWTRARCVVVIPELKKAALVIGGEYGKGVMSCRTGDQWGAPAFMQLAKGSWGFQAGAEQVDVVLLVMNEEGVDKLLRNKVNLGADASIAAGPIGRQGHVGTDAALTAEILSYSRAQGLFAGIDLSGGVLRPDDDANAEVYGKGVTAKNILSSRELSAPTQAAAFLNALKSQPGAAPAERTPQRDTTAGPAASTPPAPRTVTPSTTDDDLRARIVDIQQSLDRLLADTTPSAVGTTGSTGASSNVVTVDRARLLQLRQQLDSLIAIVNRR